MALVAKENCYIGFTVAAVPGNLVAPEAVEKYGWQDKVEDDGSGEGSDAAAAKKSTKKSE